MARVTVYTTNYCSYCRAAKSLLERKGAPYTEIDLSEDWDTRNKLEMETGMRTMPMIFINDQLVGGYRELAALDANGELDLLLRKEE